MLETDEDTFWWEFQENLDITADYIITMNGTPGEMRTLFETPWELTELFWLAVGERLDTDLG